MKTKTIISISKLLLIVSIFAIVFISITRTQAADTCYRYENGYFDEEEWFSGWCWTTGGTYLGYTTECPGGSGGCTNWDCVGDGCDWIPASNPGPTED
ncbi:MAG: hypothetical protein KAH17_01490 [Bacteroidales bacterium]|nr:hypothetical protein [Bacteroidales bacterium]